MPPDTHVHQLIERARTWIAHPRLPGAVASLLVVVLGLQLAGVTWSLLPAAPAAHAPAAMPAQDHAGAGPAATDPAGELAALHLFGNAPSSADATGASTAPEDAPETQLNLTLRGVYAPGGGDGIAIIAAGGGAEHVYATGDTVAGGARIRGVYGDRVVLERSGHLETLRMKTAEAATGGPGGGARAAAPSADEQRIAQRAREIRQRLLSNPMELARMVRFQPYVQDGQLLGYRIQPRAADARLLGDLGLRPSDVITEINGIPLNDPGQANQALQALRDAQMINVTVLRDGAQRTMSIPIGAPG